MGFLRWRSPLQRARRAARSGCWTAAAEHYRRHLMLAPGDGAAWIQLGHSLKEAGELDTAAEAYRHALHHDSGDGNACIHLAHLEWRLGRREEAIRVLTAAVSGAGDVAEQAGRALIDMGARDLLPISVQRRIEVEAGDYALARYAAWRTAREISPHKDPEGVLVVIDARGSTVSAREARAMLPDLACLVLGDRPGASIHPEGAIDLALSDARYVLLVDAATRLAPDAIAQLCAALETSGAGAAYCDHDHWAFIVDGTISFTDPCLQPMADPIWFQRPEVRPPCLLVRAAAAVAARSWGRLADDRMALPVHYAHVPLMLASRSAGFACGDVPLSPVAFVAKSDPIQVVIQTRDAPDMLRACVEQLRAAAMRPDVLDIVIMDNRSVLPKTKALLASWAAAGIARTIPHDEPFNWARANNLAVEQGRAPLLLFLNNDVEVETPGWDDALRAGLADPGTGVMGALLLYPDRLIQHAGVIFGMGAAGSPVHEGVGRALEPGGPAARWRYPRLAAAVTGAWLATTRALFGAVGGFEERLPIAYNDIDFCLRCRAFGSDVVQASGTVAIHHESATRGTTMSAAEKARDQADWEWLRRRWGTALDLDPAYNPNWVRSGRPFDGLRHPTPEAVGRWITASAQRRPWAVGVPGDP